MKENLKRKIIVFAGIAAVFLAFFVFPEKTFAAFRSDGRNIVFPPPVPAPGSREVSLPYPPGPDFSWIRKDNFRLQGFTNSEPAASSTYPHRLTAGAYYSLDDMPWYIQVLFIIFIAILLVISYFLYRYNKSKMLISRSIK